MEEFRFIGGLVHWNFREIWDSSLSIAFKLSERLIIFNDFIVLEPQWGRRMKMIYNSLL